MFKRILVPIDGSKPSKAGLRTALRLASEQGARVKLVHLAQEVPVASSDNTDMSVGELYARLRQAGQSLLDRAAKLCSDHGVAAQSRLYVGLGGRASEMILTEAKRWHADLIVMGTHGRHGLSRLAFGSNAEHVVRNANAPVLLIRAR